MAKKRLGQLLLERGLIDEEQLEKALSYHRQWNQRLGSALVSQGAIAEGTLTRVLAESLSIPMVDLAKVSEDKEALALLKAEVCERYEVFPIAVKHHRGRKTLLLAMSDPLNVAAIDEIAFTTDMTVRPTIAQISSIGAAIRAHYHNQPVEIPPLDFTTPTAQPAISDVDDDDEMTIITGQGEERVLHSEDGEQWVDLKHTDLSAFDPNLYGEEAGEAIDKVEAAMEAERQRATEAGEPAYALPADENPFEDQPTGTFLMAQMVGGGPPPDEGAAIPATQFGFAVDTLSSTQSAHAEGLESLEKKFWALMRVLARKNIITKDEFLQELNKGG
jgi:hypothetical protein